MADTQTLVPVDPTPNRLPVPGLGGRFAPVQDFVRQPAVQRALPMIATSAVTSFASGTAMQHIG